MDVFLLGPGGCLVVGGAGFEASVEDADEPVGGPPLMMPAMASPGLSGQAVSTAGGRLLMARAPGGPCAGLR
jgi:hypothetical protein